jgi:hypothetical protein
MSKLRWEFREIKQDETKVEGQHLELFKSEALSEMVHALIREDIQNRLDQQGEDKTAPVRIKYSLSSPEQKLSVDSSKKWFLDLDFHLNSEGSKRQLGMNSFNLNQNVSFLTIEDFNTTGLVGDTSQTRDPRREQIETEGRNDFYWFIRNVGRSIKGGSDRGRWGLGKVVYPAASEIRSFFAYSVRESDGRNILIGRSVLGIHTIGETEFDSEGYFALFDDKEFPYYATPTSDETAIEQFKRDFNVSRRDNEPGLSLVIPFPDNSINFKSLINSAIEHFFWEIMSGRLELEFCHGARKQQISHANLRDFVSTWKGFADETKNEMRRMVDFCRKADNLSLRDDSYFELKEPRSKKNPNMKKVFNDGELEKAIEFFNEGRLLAFECPVKIRKSSTDNDVVASFLVYLQKDPELMEKSHTVIRRGLTIIGEKRIKEPGIRALLLAEDDDLSEFLGDAENPAHTRWLHSTKHFKGKYYNGSATLSYIQNMTQLLSKTLSRQDDARLDDLLQNIFNLEEENEDEAHEAGRKKGRKTPRKPKVVVVPKPRYLRIRTDFENGGFHIQGADEMTRRPNQITLRVAYEQLTGNPFNDYHPSDFNFESEKNSPVVDLLGCSISERDCNRIVFNIEEDDFLIEITGFDKKRDLRIDAKPLISDENEEEMP